MRASLVTAPPLIGTFKSSRIRTRLPDRSKSDILMIFNASAPDPLHRAFDHASVVSSMRFEKPHSLSYQAQALTSVPSRTLVSVASKVEDAGSWLKSTETSG